MTVIIHPPDHAVIAPGALTLSGTAPPNSLVQVMDWLLPVGQTIADEGGRWALEVENNVEGNHAYRAVAIAADGKRNISTLHWIMCDRQLVSVPLTVPLAPVTQKSRSFATPRRRDAARIARTVPFAVGLLALVLLLTGILVLLHRSQNGSHRVPESLRSPVTASRPSSVATTTWTFPALHMHASQVLLALLNSSSHAMTSEIVVQGKVVRRIRVQAGTGSEVELSPRWVVRVITIRGRGLGVPPRLIVQDGRVRLMRALPGAKAGL